MEKTPAFPLQVFYDGSCIVCSAEIDRYRKKRHAETLVFIDISDPEFEPARYGKTREEFMAQMQVLDAEGRFFSGVDAFPAIWQALPGIWYRRLGKALRLPVIHGLARLGYRLFARYRGYLPKRREHCHGGTCTPGPRR